jgi:hypothetical protein
MNTIGPIKVAGCSGMHEMRKMHQFLGSLASDAQVEVLLALLLSRESGLIPKVSLFRGRLKSNDGHRQR